MTNHRLFDMQSDEHLIYMARKHWLLLARDTVGTILAALMPIALWFFVVSKMTESENAPLIFVFMSALWLALSFMALATAWTHYYLDIWAVTDKRIMYLEQTRLFVRQTTTLRIERIQDATVSFANAIETLLNFGTLRIQSAGAIADDLVIKGIPDPERAKRLILEEVDRQAKTRSAGTPPTYNPAGI